MSDVLTQDVTADKATVGAINSAAANAFSLTKHGLTSDYDGKRAKRGDIMDGNTHSSVSDMTHEQLMVKIADDRDRAAFAVVFDYFAPRVKSHLMKMGLNSQGAEDMAQDVLVIVWQKAFQFDPQKAKLSTWIFRIARNKFIDLTRKQKYPEVNADDHMHNMLAPEETDKPIEQMQDAEIVSSALEHLNEDQRKVIDLSFYKEMSHSQIAEHLSLPLGTVKSRIRLAFQVLRKKMGDTI